MTAKNKMHKTWWDEEDMIVRLEVHGYFDEDNAKSNVYNIANIKRQFPGKKLRFLIDLTDATRPSPEARKIIMEEIFKDAELKKISIIAPSIMVRIINNYMVRVSGADKDKIKMFPTEREALNWFN